MHKVSMQLQYAKVREGKERIGTRDKEGRDQEKKEDEEGLTPL